MTNSISNLGHAKAPLSNDEIKRLLAERDAERALADQLADALRAVQHDRPSAHTDGVWASINQALITYEEARRG